MLKLGRNGELVGSTAFPSFSRRRETKNFNRLDSGSAAGKTD